MNPVVPCPAGYYHNIAFDEYAGLPGLSKSELDYFRKSPEHYADYLLGLFNRDETDAMQFGRMTHAWVLEGRKDWVSSPYKDFRSNEAKAWRDAQTQPVITPAEEAALFTIRDAVRCDRRASELLGGIVDGITAEVSMFADDKDYGLRLKGRADGVGADYFLDLKTVADASNAGLSGAIAKYGWHRQASWYLRIARILGKPQTKFYFIAVEKSDPPRVNVRELHPNAIELGNFENGEDVKRFLECKASNSWPGYSGPGKTIQFVDLPAWSYAKMAGSELIIGGETFAM